MKYWYQQPHAALSGHIRTILVLEGFSHQAHHPLPLFTNGMAALVCRTEGREDGNIVKQLVLFGRSTPPGYWSVNERTTVIAYFFKPFSMAAMFNIAAADLINHPVELAAWHPQKTNAIKIQLHSSSTTPGKIAVLDHLLVRQLEERDKECNIIQYATDEIMNNSGTDVLPAILEKLHITERTFQRIFKKFVGISAVQYRRICQFQGSFDQLRSNEFGNLTDVAFDNGFADQSHFIRSFREFTQTTPGSYLRSGLGKKEE